ENSPSVPYWPVAWNQGAFFRRGIVRIRAGLTALVIVVLAVAVGCTSSGGDDAPAAATATTTAGHSRTTTAAPLAADASPREVRARSEQLLGQHALPGQG